MQGALSIVSSEVLVLLSPSDAPTGVGIALNDQKLEAVGSCCLKTFDWSASRDRWLCYCGTIHNPSIPTEPGKKGPQSSVLYLISRHSEEATKWVSLWTGIPEDQLEITVEW